MIAFLIKVVAAYMVGSVMGSLIVGRLYGGVDVRREGSGNAGATNALRTHGGLFAFWVMLIDVGKGLLAVTVIAGAALPGLAAGDWSAWLPVACGAAAVVGHVWPLWFGFRGGKGAATLVAVVAVLEPLALIPVLGTWIVVLVLTGYVGLATILAATAAAVFGIVVANGDPANPFFVFATVMALFTAYTHRSNIRRMLDGTEHRFEKARIFHRS